MKICLCFQQTIFWGRFMISHISCLCGTLWPSYVYFILPFGKNAKLPYLSFLSLIVTHFKKALVNFILKSWSLHHSNVGTDDVGSKISS